RPRATTASAADGTEGVPAVAGRTPVLPQGTRGATPGALVRPVERVAELERASILVEGRARLAASLEHRAEISVDDRQGRGTHRLAAVTGPLVRVAEGERRRQERAVRADRVPQVDEPGGRAPTGELGAPELVVDHGQPLGFGRTFRGRHRVDDPLLEIERFRPPPRGGGEVAQT